jgi:hypothetical protein
MRRLISRLRTRKRRTWRYVLDSLTVLFHSLNSTQERLKKEYKTANRQRDGHIDESDDEDMPEITKQGKAIQKMIRNREGNEAYDSDDEKNPYASVSIFTSFRL